MGLLGIGGVFLFRIAKDYRAVANDQQVMQAYARSQTEIEHLSHALQAERQAALYVAAKLSPVENRAEALKRRVSETERAVEAAKPWLDQLDASDEDSGFLKNVKAYRELLSTLPEIRRRTLSGELSVSAVMAGYSRILFGALTVVETHRRFLKNAEATSDFDGILTVDKMREQDEMIAGMFAVAEEGYAMGGADVLVISKQYFALAEGDSFLRRCFPDLRQFYAARLKSDPVSSAYFTYLNLLSVSFKAGSALPPFSLPDLKLPALMAKRSQQSEETVEYGFGLATTRMRSAIDAQRNLALNLGFAIATALGLSLIVNLTVARSLKVRIAGVADEISSAAGGVRVATAQSTEASVQIAANATTYAAALSQIGSAFREITQTARLNDAHTQKGDTLALGANTSVDSGRGAIRDLGSAMDAIGGSSQKISKIVSRINELSFQTNILALNAAIEAARAGEAGAGFSVVAEEVRRLAHQCAAAADETNSLIEESSRHASLAVEKSGHVSRVFDEISASVREVGVIIAEISKNHRDQTDQIGQANQAVVDQLTRSQTSSSEAAETDRTAALLQSQVAALTRSVEVLNAMVSRRTETPKASFEDDLSPDVSPRPLINRLATPDPALFS